MKDWIPHLGRALGDEIDAVRSKGIRRISLSGGEPREPQTLGSSGVTAIWYQLPTPGLVPDDEQLGQVRLGTTTYECSILEAESDRVLVSIEHPNGPLDPNWHNADLILDPSELLQILLERLQEA